LQTKSSQKIPQSVQFLSPVFQLTTPLTLISKTTKIIIFQLIALIWDKTKHKGTSRLPTSLKSSKSNTKTKAHHFLFQK